jgi:hypothetical protein
VDLTSFKLRRKGFCIAMGYSYTFHFCQGASFNLGDPWLLHLTPPPDNAGLDGQGILVASTRFQATGDLYMLEPLYDPHTPGDEDRVVEIFEQALRRNADLDAEDARLTTLDAATRTAHLPRLAAVHGLIHAGDPPPLSPLPMPSVEDITAQLDIYERSLGRWA